jgi:hypothetical protein
VKAGARIIFGKRFALLYPSGKTGAPSPHVKIPIAETKLVPIEHEIGTFHSRLNHAHLSKEAANKLLQLQDYKCQHWVYFLKTLDEMVQHLKSFFTDFEGSKVGFRLASGPKRYSPRSPSFDNIHPFGCLVLARTPSPRPPLAQSAPPKSSAIKRVTFKPVPDLVDFRPVPDLIDPPSIESYSTARSPSPPALPPPLEPSTPFKTFSNFLRNKNAQDIDVRDVGLVAPRGRSTRAKKMSTIGMQSMMFQLKSRSRSRWRGGEIDSLCC